MLDHVSIRDISTPDEIYTDWERFQSVASDPISPETQIHILEDDEKAARNFAASIASAYSLSTNKFTLSEIYEELPELDRLLQFKHRLRKLWQENRNPACKMAVNWVINTIRRMTRKKTKERWETTMGNCEVSPQDVWSIEEALVNRDAPNVPTAVHGYSGLKFLPYDKANAIADCLENRFTHHDLCDESHEGRVENIVQDILETEDTAPWKKK
jgi:hypothetical protein